MDRKWIMGRVGYEEARYRFILTELDLAITFADIALSSGDSDTRHRNIGHARLAYDSATRHMNEGPLDAQKQRAVQSKVRKVKNLFKMLPSREREVSSR
jgi:hypothetical protein